MNFAGFLTIFAFTELILAEAPRDYVKMLKAEFNQTGDLCQGAYLNLTPVSRYDTIVDGGCVKLKWPLYEIFGDFRLWVKVQGATNYRQVIDLKNVQPCKIMANRKWFPALNYLVDRAKAFYPEIIHDCPYTEFKVKNASINFLNDLNEEDKKWLMAPTGVYKAHAKVWDGTGNEGEVTAWAEAKFRHSLFVNLS